MSMSFRCDILTRNKVNMIFLRNKKPVKIVKFKNKDGGPR